ncbi:hypothetical protein [Yoonia sp. SS1-5]|uniref:Uncharacterized protein n=1 Tax=Yoonia rhodophyticola TaxID=3137370 RepID=A0AAN0MGN7_9RHOB
MTDRGQRLFNLLKLALIAAAPFFAGDARAQGMELVFTQEIGGPYTQDWWTAYLTDAGEAGHEIYVKGDGKNGDFFGVLRLDCATPRLSRWLALGGYLSEDDVPAEAVREIRQRYC